MKDKTNLRGWLIALLSGVLLFVIARGAGAMSQSRHAPLLQDEIPTRTMVPTVTGWPSPTPTLTPTEIPPGTPTFTVTPTSRPGEPTLIYPVDGGLLLQPVPPGEWYFEWFARHGPCLSWIAIGGPGGRGLYAERRSEEVYEFQFVTDTFLPGDARGPLYWRVGVECPLGYNYSELRTFLCVRHLRLSSIFRGLRNNLCQRLERMPKIESSWSIRFIENHGLKDNGRLTNATNWSPV